MILKVVNLEELQNIIRLQARVLVVYTQPDTCIPCKRLYPHLVVFADKHIHPTIAVVDLDEVPEAMVEYDLRTVPTLHLYENGRYVNDVKGRTVIQLENELL